MMVQKTKQNKKKMELKEKLKETSCKGDERLKGKSQGAQKNHETSKQQNKFQKAGKKNNFLTQKNHAQSKRMSLKKKKLEPQKASSEMRNAK